MSPELAAKLAEHGILGLLLALAIWVIYRQDLALTAERTGRREDGDKHRAEIKELQGLRLTDQQAYGSKLLELNTTVYGTVDKLAEVADRFSQVTPDRRRSHA